MNDHEWPFNVKWPFMVIQGHGHFTLNSVFLPIKFKFQIYLFTSTDSAMERESIHNSHLCLPEVCIIKSS